MGPETQASNPGLPHCRPVLYQLSYPGSLNAVDERSSPYYALRDRQGNAIGVTACDIDGDGREEIYFLNTNNAFSGKGCGPWAFPAPTFLLPSPGYSHRLPQAQALPPPGPRFVPAITQQ